MGESCKYKGKIDFAFELFSKYQRPIAIQRQAFRAGFTTSRHRHDFPQIWYCLTGSYEHTVNDQQYHCTEGSMVIVPAGAEHQFWFEGDAEIISLCLHYSVLDTAEADEFVSLRTNLFLPVYFEKLGLSFEPYKLLSPASQQNIEQVFSWLFLLNYPPHNLASHRQVLEKLEEMFSIPEYAVPRNAKKKAVSITQNRLKPFLRILEYLNTHYPEKITDEQLLQVANLSRAVMYRHFKEILGDTYSRYLQHLRSRHAHCLFRDGTFTNSQIAELCGFYSSYHMAQTYTRFFKTTPNEQRLYMERVYGNRNSD